MLRDLGKLGKIKSVGKGSTLLFINLSKFWRRTKNRAWLARKQSQKIHTLKTEQWIELGISIWSTQQAPRGQWFFKTNKKKTKERKIKISKVQTSYHGQFMLRNSNKPTKTEQCTLFQLIYIGSSKLWKIYVVGYCLGGSDRIDVQSFHLNIVLAAAVGNAITASKVTARKNLGISSSTVLIVNRSLQ